jgi:hypothetical protein
MLTFKESSKAMITNKIKGYMLRFRIMDKVKAKFYGQVLRLCLKISLKDIVQK